MNYLMVISADTNDADWVESSHQISEVELEKFLPLIEAIKNFKPYKGGNYTHKHNFPCGGDQPRDDMGEKNVNEIYKDIDPDIIEEFCEMIPLGEYGVHTIGSITLYEIKGTPKELI